MSPFGKLTAKRRESQALSQSKGGSPTPKGFEAPTGERPPIK